jgi:hypothetical protein
MSQLGDISLAVGDLAHSKEWSMKRNFMPILSVAVTAATSFIASRPFAAADAVGEGSPIYGVTIPTGYRQWEVIAPSQEVGLDELRVILGNAISMKTYREGTLPFPDGAMLAKLAWKRVPSPGDGPRRPSFPAQRQPSKSWSKIQRDSRRRAVWALAGSLMENRSTRPSTRHVSRVTRSEQKGTTCSLRNTNIERLAAEADLRAVRKSTG